MAEDKKVEEKKEEKTDSTKKSDGQIDLATEGGGGGGGGKELDKMLTGLHAKLDDCMKKMDSMGSRMDAMEMDRKDRHKDDSAKADKHRDDDDAKKDSKKRDDDDAKKDAKSRDDSKHRDDDDDAKKDKHKKDADPEDKDMAKETVADKKRKDAAEDEKKEEKKEDAVADSNEDIRRQIAELQQKIPALAAQMPAQMTDEDYHAIADVQETADRVFVAFGSRAPIPLRGETATAYDIRLLTKLQPHSSNWKSVDLTKLPPDALKTARTQIYADAMVAANSPDTVPDGSLRMITRKMPSGHIENTFVGAPQAWMGQFARGRSRFATMINPKPQGN